MCHIFNLSLLCISIFLKIVVTVACTPHAPYVMSNLLKKNKSKRKGTGVYHPKSYSAPEPEYTAATQLYISRFMRWNNHVTRLSAAIQWARLVCPLPSSLWYWWSFWVVQVLRSVSVAIHFHHQCLHEHYACFWIFIIYYDLYFSPLDETYNTQVN